MRYFGTDGVRGVANVPPITPQWLLTLGFHAVRVAREIQGQGWDVRAIRTPTVPDGTARLRLSVHADHSLELLMEVAAELVEAMDRKVGV